MEGNKALLLVFTSLAVAATLVQGKGTRVGFYSSTCPRAEVIVKSTIQSYYQNDVTLAPALLRLHFHDCFVMGCDVSVLISGLGAEKTANNNLGLRGYEVIDAVKTQLEVACPGVVSCADILALAARDVVVLTGGPSWQVPTGRRDGRISLASNANNLPGQRDSIDVQKRKFAALGLNIKDLVVLVGGGHTLGTSACKFFKYRLYNFSNTSGNGADPSINPAFVSQLRALCPRNDNGTRDVALDTGSPNKFDKSFFTNLRNGRGILESDQKLWTDASTRIFVRRFLGARGLRGLSFHVEFGRSMVKMSSIGVKTGTNGEIRRVCYAIN